MLYSTATTASGGDTINLAERYQAIRQRSLDLIQTLSAEDCSVQSMPDASPAKWHLAHSTWFFETLVLDPYVPAYRKVDPRYDYLFNSYYNSLGERHARPARGLLSRPNLSQVLEYREHVDALMLELLEDAEHDVLQLCEVGLNHEQQHQELLLTDIKHAFWCNPIRPTYREQALAVALPPSQSWQSFDAGVYEIGMDTQSFCYDNETPCHREFLEAFEISESLVSNEEYLEFIEAGGYRDPQYWLSDGWDWVCRENISAPLYWQHDGHWFEFTLHGLKPLQAEAPASHLSFYEADAYARWVGARLPREAEWEMAAELDETLNDSLHAHAHNYFGQCWQWTASPYQAYPGYCAPTGPLGEYNAKFMCNQLVLRGSSALTAPGHSRPSYRNFFYPQSRWQMTGLRLARDLA